MNILDMSKKSQVKLDRNDNSILQDNANVEELLWKTEMKKLDTISLEDIVMFESSSKEEIYSLLVHKTTENQRLQLKVKECNELLLDRTEQCEKLSKSLEQQQGTVLCKFNRLSETYSRERKQSEDIITHFEDSEKELISVIGKLQEENVTLQTKLEDVESEKLEFERERKDFFERQAASEELQDFQKQELAKLKHMLLNSEKEVKKLQFELNENISCLMKSRERNDELENFLSKTIKKNETVQASLNECTFEKNKLLKRLVEIDELYKCISTENAELKNKLSFVNGDLRKVRRSLSNVESTHRNVSDKYEYLRHNSEAVLNKAQNDMEEKESKILHLEHKLRMMEELMESEKLPRDQQIQILLDQRTDLEERLGESQQQLLNIKLTWSDKINQLEKQVANLNSKIAEDCEELSIKSNTIDYLRRKMEEKTKTLSSQVTSLSEENQQLRSEKENEVKMRNELQIKLKEQEIRSGLELEEKMKRLLELEEHTKSVEEVLQSKVCEISLKLNESSNILNNLKNMKIAKT